MSAGAGAMPRVLVAIVTYNSAAHVGACLDSIACATAALEVVVVDNASKDRSAAIARAHGLRPLVMEAQENLGFGRAVNRAARGRSFDHLLLVNPDAVLHAGAIERLVALARERPEAGLYGGRSNDPRGQDHPESAYKAPDLAHAVKFAACFGFVPGTARLAPDAFGGEAPAGTREVPALEGSLLMVTRAAWQRLGGFDERFFLYGEDIDLAMRARALGYRPLFCDAVRYTHVRGASSAGKAHNMRLVLKGRAMLYRRYARGRIGVALLALGVLLRATFEPLVRSSDTWRQCWRARADWLEEA